MMTQDDRGYAIRMGIWTAGWILLALGIGVMWENLGAFLAVVGLGAIMTIWSAQ